MNKILVGLTAAALAWSIGAAEAKGSRASTSSGSSHSVSGYTKKDGTYVAPSHATNPNGTKNDNYSTKGNTNPYTGKAGTKKGDGE